MIVKLDNSAAAAEILALPVPVPSAAYALISCWINNCCDRSSEYTFADLHSAIGCSDEGAWKHAGVEVSALPDGSIEIVFDADEPGSVRYVATRRDRSTVDISPVDIGWGEGRVNRVTVTLLSDGGLESGGVMDWGAITDDDGEALAKWIEIGSGEEFAWDGPMIVKLDNSAAAAEILALYDSGAPCEEGDWVVLGEGTETEIGEVIAVLSPDQVEIRWGSNGQPSPSSPRLLWCGASRTDSESELKARGGDLDAQ